MKCMAELLLVDDNPADIDLTSEILEAFMAQTPGTQRFGWRGSDRFLARGGQVCRRVGS